jgi:hypothetical protein
MKRFRPLTQIVKDIQIKSSIRAKNIKEKLEMINQKRKTKRVAKT